MLNHILFLVAIGLTIEGSGAFDDRSPVTIRSSLRDSGPSCVAQNWSECDASGKSMLSLSKLETDGSVDKDGYGYVWQNDGDTEVIELVKLYEYFKKLAVIEEALATHLKKCFTFLYVYPHEVPWDQSLQILYNGAYLLRLTRDTEFSLWRIAQYTVSFVTPIGIKPFASFSLAEAESESTMSRIASFMEADEFNMPDCGEDESYFVLKSVQTDSKPLTFSRTNITLKNQSTKITAKGSELLLRAIYGAIHGESQS